MNTVVRDKMDNVTWWRLALFFGIGVKPGGRQEKSPGTTITLLWKGVFVG